MSFSPVLLIFSFWKFSFLYSSTVVKTKSYIVHYLERFLQKKVPGRIQTDIEYYILRRLNHDISRKTSQLTLTQKLILECVFCVSVDWSNIIIWLTSIVTIPGRISPCIHVRFLQRRRDLWRSLRTLSIEITSKWKQLIIKHNFFSFKMSYYTTNLRNFVSTLGRLRSHFAGLTHQGQDSVLSFKKF